MYTKTIDSKPIIEIDGVKCVDFTVSIFNPGSGPITDYRLYMIPMDFEMRPDLISLASFRDEKYTELVLKYNGISNPFSLVADDIVIIPDVEQIYNPIKDKVIGTVEETGIDPEGDITHDKLVRRSYKYLNRTEIFKQIDKKKNNKNSEFDNAAVPNYKIGNKRLDDRYKVPYIADMGEFPLVGRNGRVYIDGSVGPVAGRNDSDGVSTLLTGGLLPGQSEIPGLPGAGLGGGGSVGESPGVSDSSSIFDDIFDGSSAIGTTVSYSNSGPRLDDRTKSILDDMISDRFTIDNCLVDNIPISDIKKGKNT